MVKRLEKSPKRRKRKRDYIKSHLRNIGMALISFILMVEPAAATNATDAAKVSSEVLATEGGKEVLNTALKVARGKPTLSIAAGIVCMACIPVAAVPASASMCVACGILIAKVFG